ncbi:class I SAM-dependent methyltransferase [Candidatus Micrarchaeota archaeon]|nr:class I SAM-dependent methyltransferase [Candidatus Micrarchaeota archaeon]
MTQEMKKLYGEVKGEFYEEAMEKSNPLTRHYHQNRYEKIRRFIKERIASGMKIVDIGSGSSTWNTYKWQVTAVDLSKNLIEFGMKKGHITEFVLSDIEEAKIPLESGKFDFAVISEVLEHMKDPKVQVREANRLLKKGGILILTVPLDVPLSPWWFLFNIGCIIRGDLMGNEYFKKRCGHIQHFEVDTIGKMVEDAGFKIIKKNVDWLNIGLMCEKQ